MNEMRLLASAIVLWCALWTLIAAAQPPLPRADLSADTDAGIAMRERLAAPLQSVVAQHLGSPDSDVHLTDLETLRLRRDVAEVRFHGLLQDNQLGPRALLVVDAELDRRSLNPRTFAVRVLVEPEPLVETLAASTP